jgi:hypothetical protein
MLRRGRPAWMTCLRWWPPGSCGLNRVGVRGRMCEGYAARHLGERDGVLIVDETGFLNKGTKVEFATKAVLATTSRRTHPARLDPMAAHPTSDHRCRQGTRPGIAGWPATEPGTPSCSACSPKPTQSGWWTGRCRWIPRSRGRISTPPTSPAPQGAGSNDTDLLAEPPDDAIGRSRGGRPPAFDAVDYPRPPRRRTTVQSAQTVARAGHPLRQARHRLPIRGRPACRDHLDQGIARHDPGAVSR